MVIRKRILVATTNPGKFAEISAMLGAGVQWVSLADFKDLSEIEEDGKTFAENACKKALGYAKQTGLWTIADDSGLMIDALGGRPGVRSARFAESHRKERRDFLDKKNIEKLLMMLRGAPKEKRTARFVCCLCLASPEKILTETQGELAGLIAEKEIGENGFGYDPIFFVPQLSKTVAQLTADEKNAISHRGNAIHKLKPLLNELLKTA